MGEFTTEYTPMRARGYEGATTAYRMEQKGLQNGDQDTIAARELKNLWNRSHYLVRNNACAITAKKRLAANWVGKGIVVRWLNPNKSKNKKMQALWDAWIKECAWDGYGDFNSMQALWAGGLFESGEIFTRFIVAKRKASAIPLALQVLEAEQLDPMLTRSKGEIFGSGSVMGTTLLEEDVRTGIGFSNGVPSTYYFWKEHPGRKSTLPLAQNRVAVPVDEIVHIFERERPGQWRGVPMLAPVMLNIYEMDELTDATLQRQKAAQAISWIIENTNPTSAIAPGMVRAVADPDSQTPEKKKLIIESGGGNVTYLNKGETARFAVVDDIGRNLQVMLVDEWSKIAAALGLAYHQMTGDLSEVNFSSIRAGLNELRIRVEMIQQNLFITQGIAKITAKFQEFAGLYVSKAMEECVANYYVPRRYGVDELKDAQSDLMEVQAGFATLESKLAERGITFEEVVADRERVKAAKLIVSSIPETMPKPEPATNGEQKPDKAQTAADGTKKADKTNSAKTQPEK